MANMNPLADAPRVLESYDDVEDTIHEIHDAMWIVADCIASNEPLATKQAWEDVDRLYKPFKDYVESLNPEPTDESSTANKSNVGAARQATTNAPTVPTVK